MKRSLKALVTALLIAVPVITSCADVSGPVTAAPTIERQDGLIESLLGGVLKVVFDILSGPDANGSQASAWIGTGGGTLSTAAYTLIVPQGAVGENTKFVVEPVNDGTYTVQLHAYKQGLLGLVDVGAKGFKKPVTLRVSYANAVGVLNEKKIIIVYLDDGNAEIQTTIVDTSKDYVYAPLSHFSKYAMAQN
jgi:hypothetical protein